MKSNLLVWLGLVAAVVIVGVMIVRRLNPPPPPPTPAVVDVPNVEPEPTTPRHMILREEPAEQVPATELMNPEIAEKWFREEGYTKQDIEDAMALLREQGYPEQSLQDPGLIRRHLLPRVVTSVQVAAIDIAPEVPADTPIPFRLRGTVPAHEFNFTKFDIIRQADIIRIRALGHSRAFDGESPPAGMHPVELEGQLDPLPPGTYRIIIPDLGMSGTITFTVTP